MSKRAALIATGAILTLGGATLAATGGAVVAAIGTDGTFSSRGTVTSTTAALVSERGVIEDRGAGALGRPSVEIGVTDSAKPVFVGVGPARDVDRYLAGAAVETVTDFDVAPLHLTGSVSKGSRQLDAPGDQDFWVERSEGSNAAATSWKLRGGEFRVVIMNADGSAGIEADGQFGLHIPVVAAIGAVGLAGGLGATVIGAILLVLGLRTAGPAQPADESARHETVAA
ncbi:MAG TPA: hypothetical protein VF423_02580 [Actinomycetes bacterium]